MSPLHASLEAFCACRAFIGLLIYRSRMSSKSFGLSILNRFRVMGKNLLEGCLEARSTVDLRSRRM
jgi:hypothetical protein